MAIAPNEDASGVENNRMQSARWCKMPVTTHRKEALLRALSDLEVMKRKGEPELAQEIVARHHDHNIKKFPLPPLIASFLGTHWRPYMAQLYVLEGEQSEPWRNAVENTETLTWSVQPKCDKESCQRLYALLPKLLQWVHVVLESQQIGATDEDEFFAALARFHVAALHPDPKTVAASAPDVAHLPIAGENRATPRRNARDSIAHGVEARDTRLARPQTDQAPNADSDLLRDLVVGSWVEFQSERATKRVLRLEWISRCGGVYLFRDEKRGDALCLTAKRCIQCLRERSASILD